MTDLITLSSSALPDEARVIGFRGVEALSRPYEIEVYFTLVSADAEHLDMADAVGARAVISVDRGEPKTPPYLLSGIFGAVEMLQEVGERTLLRATVVPRLRQLALSRHSRIFSKMAFPDILQAILLDNGLSGEDFELRLASYDVEEHVCQYRESDLDFVSRWMEREGIYYFFEHGEHGDKVVFCDSKAYQPDVLGAPVRYHPQTGSDVSAGASFRSFSCRHTTLPATVKLKDYDYTHPTLSVVGSAAVSRNGAGEVSLYGERFFTPAAGQRLAKIRAEELLARQVLVHASGTRAHLRPGHTFDLEDHPRAAFNARYLAIEISHHGNQAGQGSGFDHVWTPLHEEVYFGEVVAIPEATQFRAESRAPWPRVYGYEHGVVDGAADSEYAQIDDHGRYKVKFAFDESSLKGGAASTFVRMMQPHGGSVEGFHFPLRKATEVVLSFLGGDPDRPVISGVVPNALTPSPVTSGNHTMNVIQTGAKNLLAMDDKTGCEQIRLYTPFDTTSLTLGSPWDGVHSVLLYTLGKTRFYGFDNWDIEYQGWKDEHIHGIVKEVYENSQTTDIKLNDRRMYVHAGSHETHVAKHQTTSATEGVRFFVNDAFTEGTIFSAEKGFYVTASERIYLKSRDKTFEVEAKQDIKITSDDGVEISIDAKSGKVKIHAAKGIEFTSDAGIDLTATEKITQNCKQDAVQVNGSSTTFTQGITDDTFVGGSISKTLAGRLDLALAADLSVFAGLKIDLNLAAAFNLNLLTVNYSFLDYTTCTVDLKKKECAAWIQPFLASAGFKVFS